MSRVKEILVRVIPAKIAREFVIKYHYSGKVVNNSILHFGAFLDNRLHGVLSFGSSLDKRKVVGLVEGTLWNEFLELNRMAFDECLPKYSESRCIGIAIRLIKKNYPHIKWIVSFADGMQCGDGTIYRASGFSLLGMSSGSMVELPEDLEKLNGSKYAHRMKMQDKHSVLSREILKRTNGRNFTNEKCAEMFNVKVVEGYMLKYIYLIDKLCKITVPIIPFSRIQEMGAGMYLGKKRFLCAGSSKSEQTISNSKDGGVIPTPALHISEVA